MTYGVMRSTDVSELMLTKPTEIEQLNLSKGDKFRASVVDLRNTSISISVDGGAGQQIINLELFQKIELNINDQIEIKVLESNKDGLQLSFRKLDAKNEIGAMNHNPILESVNLNEIKKTITTTDNPLQYSKQLDNHIQHAIAQVETILGSFSDETINAIISDNFDTTKMTIDLLYQVGHSNRIDKKIALDNDVDRSVKISVNEEKIQKLIDEMNSNNILKKVEADTLLSITKELVNNEIKPELKNVEKLIHFTEKVDNIKNMSPKDIVQFLSSNKDSTIGELYKSLFVSSKTVKKDVISEQDYQQIEAEVKKIVETAFTNENVNRQEVQDIAKALVKKGIPIDERAIETIRYILSPGKIEETIRIGVHQMMKQEKLDNYEVANSTLNNEVASIEEIKEFTNLVQQVTHKEVESVVLQNRKVNFHELELKIEEIKIQEVKQQDNRQESEVQKEIQPTEEQQKIINKNTEDLQIIRYQMTYKAAMRLSIQGVDLKHTNLDMIRGRIESFELIHVDDKKVLEVTKETESIGEAILSPKESAVLEVKKHMALISGSSTRAIALAALSSEEQTVSEPEVNSLAKLARMTAVGADRYDELRTKPRADLGDRIEKAFSNIDDILDDLKLEKTVFNQRAVGILGRNEMPITVENIEKVKQVDIPLQELFNKLMPEHIKTMVDQKIDIINEPIDLLADFVKGETSLVQKDVNEEVAKHILTMLKTGELTQEKKDGLIGIYRMIHTIEGSKGAAVGYLVNNELPVTLENLFDAAKIIRQTSKSEHMINTEINDEFGKVESIVREGLSIKEQIQSGYLEKEIDIKNLVNKILDGSYEKNLTNQLIQNLNSGEENQSAKSINGEVVQRADSLNSELVRIDQANKEQELSELKEALSAVLKMQKSLLVEGASFKEKLNISSWKSLSDLTLTPDKLNTLLKEFGELVGDNEALRQKMTNQLDKYLTNVSSKGFDQFEKGVKEIIDEAKSVSLNDFFDKQMKGQTNQAQLQQSETLVSDKSIHSMAKDIQQQMGISKQLIEQEDYYTVPVMINGEMQHMSMYYFRQDSQQQTDEEEMSIYLSFSTNNLGTANIRVQLAGEESNVTVFATKAIGNQQLKRFEKDLTGLFESVGLSVNKLKYDVFNIPKPVNKDQKITTAKKVKQYYNNLFEKTV